MKIQRIKELTDTDGLSKYKRSATNKQLRSKLSLAVQQMEGRKREVWLLLLDGKSLNDIACILNISVSTVQTYYKRGVMGLKSHFKINS